MGESLGGSSGGLLGCLAGSWGAMGVCEGLWEVPCGSLGVLWVVLGDPGDRPQDIPGRSLGVLGRSLRESEASLGVVVSVIDRFVGCTTEILHVLVISPRLRLSLANTCRFLWWRVLAAHSILCIPEKITVYW